MPSGHVALATLYCYCDLLMKLVYPVKQTVCADLQTNVAELSELSMQYEALRARDAAERYQP